MLVPEKPYGEINIKKKVTAFSAIPPLPFPPPGDRLLIAMNG